MTCSAMTKKGSRCKKPHKYSVNGKLFCSYHYGLQEDCEFCKCKKCNGTGSWKVGIVTYFCNVCDGHGKMPGCKHCVSEELKQLEKEIKKLD